MSAVCFLSSLGNSKETHSPIKPFSRAGSILQLVISHVYLRDGGGYDGDDDGLLAAAQAESNFHRSIVQNVILYK